MGSSSHASIPSLFVAVLVGAVFSYILFHQNSKPATFESGAISARENQRNGVDKAFYLGVVVRFTNDQEKQKFINIFTPVAKYVKEKEFGTLSYELLNSDKDPLQILISERYKDKDYYLNVHKTSSEFLSFREKFQEMITNKNAVVDGHSYIESGIGFM